MKFDGSYEFSEPTQAGGVFVSNGREKASGKLVQIHLFPAAKSQEANRLCQRLFSQPSEVRNKILKYGQEGSASYFVTEPLPAGEVLQSWVEQLCAAPKSASVPEVSLEITAQLRQMGLTPAALAPLMPGPAGPPNVPTAAAVSASSSRPEPGDFTRTYRLDEQLSNVPAEDAGTRPETTPASSSADSGFTAVYAMDELGSSGLPPVDLPEDAVQPAAEPKKGPGLETFIGIHPSPSPTQPARPAPVVPPFESTPPPVFSLEPPPISFEPPIYKRPPAPPRPIAAPPVIVKEKTGGEEYPIPRPQSSSLDWKIVFIVVAILLVAVTIVLAVAERAS